MRSRTLRTMPSFQEAPSWLLVGRIGIVSRLVEDELGEVKSKVRAKLLYVRGCPQHVVCRLTVARRNHTSWVPLPGFSLGSSTRSRGLHMLIAREHGAERCQASVRFGGDARTTMSWLRSRTSSSG